MAYEREHPKSPAEGERNRGSPSGQQQKDDINHSEGEKSDSDDDSQANEALIAMRKHGVQVAEKMAVAPKQAVAAPVKALGQHDKGSRETPSPSSLVPLSRINTPRASPAAFDRLAIFFPHATVGGRKSGKEASGGRSAVAAISPPKAAPAKGGQPIVKDEHAEKSQLASSDRSVAPAPRKAAPSKRIRSVVPDSEEDDDAEEFPLASTSIDCASTNTDKKTTETVRPSASIQSTSTTSEMVSAVQIMKGLARKIMTLRKNLIGITDSMRHVGPKLRLTRVPTGVNKSAEAGRQVVLADILTEYAEEIDVLLDDGVGDQVDISSSLPFVERAIALDRYADGLAANLVQVEAQAREWLETDVQGKEKLRARARADMESRLGQGLSAETLKASKALFSSARARAQAKNPHVKSTEVKSDSDSA